MGKKESRLNSLISLVSFFVALASIFFAWQANQKAEEANLLAQEANSISKEANTIALLSTKSGIVTFFEPGSVMINSRGCGLEASNSFGFFSGTEISITLANTGARPASLIQIQLSDGRRSWDARGYVNGQLQELPALFEADYSGKWHFVATSWQGNNSEAEAYQKKDEYKLSVIPITLTLVFDDGNKITWQAPSWVSVRDQLSFDTLCEDVKSNWYIAFEENYK